MAKLFVGNLSFDASDVDLLTTFSQHGTVASADVPMETYSRQSRGYGFVDMPDADEALSAVDALNGYNIHGQRIEVRVVIP